MAPKKLIIDTDPGVDDTMAILAAFNSPEVEIVGLTTIFGNVRTAQATQNAHVLLKLVGHTEVPVAEGSPSMLSGLEKTAVAAFVHGEDGFGNTNQEVVQGRTLGKSAAQFIVDMVNASPGEISILALGPLTNLALAFQLDPKAAQNMAEMIVLGGAFFCDGNVNPAAEANIIGDPEAADFVLGMASSIRLVGLDVTHRCQIPVARMTELRGRGKYGTFIEQVTRFYIQYHRDAYGMEAIYAHDPTAFIAVIMPELFTWRQGPVRVIADGFAKGKTIMDSGGKNWNTENGWTGQPAVQVAVDVDSDKSNAAILERMSR